MSNAESKGPATSSAKIPEQGTENIDKPTRFELTPENVRLAIELAKRSTPGLKWGEAPYEAGDIEKCLAKGTGGVYCAWTKLDDGEEVYAAVTGNGPTSELNAMHFAHARDVIIALGEHYLTIARATGRLRHG